MMKKICFALGGLLLIAQGLYAQELTTNPAFPVDTSTITITVDCTKGNQGLLNYANTSDVYVHTGVITNKSTGPTNWLYVKFSQNFNQPNAALQATYLGNNKYSFTIPNIRAYYGVPPGEQILRIAILFRNGSGSLAQRNSDGGDMYVQVYTLNLAVQFALPPSQPKYNPVLEPINKKVGDSITVKFLSNQPATLNLYLNGALAASASASDSVARVLPITTAGNQQLVGVADNGPGTFVSDTLNFFVSGAVTIAPIPAGAKEGINYPAGDTSATLVLYAPHKHKIVVVGDFNNWTQQTNYQMNETPDSNYFWLTIGGLTPGTEYAYQYVIDDSLVLADYNTEKVLDKNVDPGIPSSTYPGLKPFPAGASGTLASVLQTHQTPYNWQVTNFQRPDKKNLLIYELWLSDFTNAGSWQGLIDTLSYLKHLGVNAVEVEPFTNFEGSNSWGYNPNFYFAPEKVYGTGTAVKQFVDACHQQGMAVIMDMVMNHSFGSSPMVQMYWNGALGVPAANNPWFNPYPTHAFNVGYQFNHESTATKAFTQRVINYWLANYHVDGYRWDLAKGFTQTKTCDATGNNCNVGAWGNYDASRVAIWDTIYNQMQAASPNSYCILEMFADQNEQKVEAATGMLLWGVDLNTSWNQASLGYSNAAPGGATWDLSPIIYSALGWAVPNNIVYQESHDDERMMYNNEQYGNSNGSGYSVKDTATGLKRDAMTTAFWAMAPGPKMLTEFGELGFDYSINWCTNGTVDASGSCRLTPKPIRWDYLKNPARLALHDVYTAMLKLRNLYPGLANPAASGLVYSLNGAVKTLQVSTDSLSVAVIGNFDVAPNSGSITFPTSGTWYNYFTGEPFTTTGSSQSFNLAAGEYRVYVSKNLTNTVTTPVLNINNDPNALHIAVYPNPVTGGNGTISYQLPGYGKASLAVMNFQGQVLATAELGDQAAGPHSLPMSQLPMRVSSLATGYYVLKLIFKQQTAQTGMLIGRR
jgi:1,4-alpha-glucan branching enzyme